MFSGFWVVVVVINQDVTEAAIRCVSVSLYTETDRQTDKAVTSDLVKRQESASADPEIRGVSANTMRQLANCQSGLRESVFRSRGL